MKILSILLLTTVTFAATPAETAIEKAQAEIAKHPDHAPYYNVLAMAYARRARETSDVQYYLPPSFTANSYLPIYAKAKWQAGVPNCPIGAGIGS